VPGRENKKSPPPARAWFFRRGDTFFRIAAEDEVGDGTRSGPGLTVRALAVADPPSYQSGWATTEPARRPAETCVYGPRLCDRPPRRTAFSPCQPPLLEVPLGTEVRSHPATRPVIDREGAFEIAFCFFPFPAKRCVWVPGVVPFFFFLLPTTPATGCVEASTSRSGARRPEKPPGTIDGRPRGPPQELARKPSATFPTRRQRYHVTSFAWL